MAEVVRINPFRPNSPIAPGMFAGRLHEIQQLEQALLQTRAGQPKSFMVTGERGIGKTSLLRYVSWLAKGDIPLGQDRFSFLVVETEIEPTTTPLALAAKIELGIRRSFEETEQAKTFLQNVWQFVRRVEALGVKLRDEQAENSTETMLDEFAFSIASTIRRIRDAKAPNLFNTHYDGILLLVDECDNASPELNFGSFLKLLHERVQRHGCNHFMVGIAGLPDVRQVLMDSHPSALRIFDELTLGRLDPKDVSWVVDRALEEAEKTNGRATSVNESGRQLLIGLSEGYPHFIQQFGYCAFAEDTDGVVDTKDVLAGAFGPHSAIRLIGDRYYRNDFYNKIQKDSYRQVLRIMADKLDDWVEKSEIKKRFRGDETVLNNAVQALRERHIILSKEGVRGVYRLQHKGFALWIKLHTSDPEQLRTAISATLPADEASQQ